MEEAEIHSLISQIKGVIGKKKKGRRYDTK